MRPIVRRHPLVSFFVLSYVLSWWAVPLGGFLPCGPVFAALIVVGLSDGRRGLRAFGRRLLPRRLRARWYLAVIAIPIAVAAAAVAVNLALGAPVDALNRLDDWYVLLAITAGRLIDPLDGPLGEEPGWRGFALPHLLQDRSPAAASLVLGGLVAGWHVPLVFLPAERLPPLFLLATVAVTFVYTWIYLRTDGSVFMTLLAHCAEGTIKLSALGLVGAASTRMTVLYTGAWCAVAVGVVVFDRQTWGARGAPTRSVATTAAVAPGWRRRGRPGALLPTVPGSPCLPRISSSGSSRRPGRRRTRRARRPT
ncbi:MAG: family intrarane metalloprotease [Solirubrobacterales bacterium]|nr:family intrarane metalloprotease [Solirubrobacterales bacterium]